jgi:hypothetical protein
MAKVFLLCWIWILIIDSNNEPIPGAKVSVNNNHYYSDFDGYVRIQATKKDTLYIECLGYENKMSLVKDTIRVVEH